jgi:hypothetical protein
MPVEHGSVTFNAAAIATAASAALPPALRTESPISVASGCDDAETPWIAYTSDLRDVNGSVFAIMIVVCRSMDVAVALVFVCLLSYMFICELRTTCKGGSLSQVQQILSAVGLDGTPTSHRLNE